METHFIKYCILMDNIFVLSGLLFGEMNDYLGWYMVSLVNWKLRTFH